jgi:hypothetical protein
VTGTGRGPAARLPSLLGLLVLLAAACATPVGVTRVDTQTAHQLLAQSAIANARPSEASQRMLRRFGLLERFDDDPAGVLAELHRGFLVLGGEDGLFALAELSFLHAGRSGDRSYYLAAAVYAYALLFPGPGQAVDLDPSDPRLRLAYDLYNFGLAGGLGQPDREELDVTPGARRLPFGYLALAVDEATWLGYRLERFVPSASLSPRGLRNRYRRPGIGASLVAALDPQAAAGRTPGARRIGPHARIPVTAFLRLDAPRDGLVTGALAGRLELYPTDQTARVVVDGHEQPLESDPTAALALWLEESPAWEAELAGLLRPSGLSWLPPDRTRDGLLLLEPYRPDRIPLVLVHGTLSSPGRWAELVNELRGDPRIGRRYQIWLYMYDTGYPIAFSGGQFRQALLNTMGEVDPTGTAPDLRRMVIVGHSQGGILARLAVTDSGTRLWDNVSRVPLDSLRFDAETREILQRSLFFTPLPFVERVIFVATPHHGSRLAVPWIARLASWVIKFPFKLAHRTVDLLPSSEEARIVREFDQVPTSIENMGPEHRLVRTLAAIPIAPGVMTHSIIAVRGDGPPEEGGDGVVQYRSARLEGAASELVVRSGHSVQGNPDAIEEIRRILLEHAGIR